MKYVLLTLLIFSSRVCAGDVAEVYKEQEDEFVYRTILQTTNLDRVLSKKYGVRYEDLITLGMATETGLIVLERSSTKGALRWLAELALIQMDGRSRRAIIARSYLKVRKLSHT